MRQQISFAFFAAIVLIAFGPLAGCGVDPTPDGDGDSIPIKPGGNECSVDCAAIRAPSCMRSVCNDGSLPGDAGRCVMVPLPNDTACDDGDACSSGDTCSDGVCVGGEMVDCSELDGVCTVGVCDPTTGSCSTARAANGTPCESGNLCSVNDVCHSGACIAGGPKDCSEVQSGCTTGVCNPSDGSCVAEPIANGSPCSDGDYCTIGDTCSAGVCVSEPKDCSDLDSTCTAGVCDSVTGLCKAEPVNEGNTCEDGDLCTVGDVCTAGACVSGAPLECSGLDSACLAGVCDPNNGECKTIPANEKSPCDDGDLCSLGAACSGGQCRGTPRDCSAWDEACLVGVCDPSTGSCGTAPVADGLACEDGDLCSIGDTCMAGVCMSGVPEDCSELDTACGLGACNPSDGSCGTVAINEGTPCDDGLTCTSATVCTGGICAGGNSPACSWTPDGCCPASCSAIDDADCACPGEQINGLCVYAPTIAAVATKAAAVAACAALGTGWELCTPAVMCLQATKEYLSDLGAGCSGGAATGGCGTSANLYVHANTTANQSYFVRGASYPGCISGTDCTVSGSETCGVALCCR